MTVQTFITDYLRREVDEIATQGYFSEDDLLRIVNRTMRTKVIPDLWYVGKEKYMPDLAISGDLTVSADSLEDDWYSGTITGVSGFTAFYRPSLQAYVAGDFYEIKLIFVPWYVGFNHVNTTGSTKTEVMACLKNDTLYVFDDDYTTVTLHAIKMPDYALTDTIELDNEWIEGLLLPGCVAACWTQDKGYTARNIYKDEYGSTMRRLIRDNPDSLMDRTPPDYFSNYYAMEDGAVGYDEYW